MDLCNLHRRSAVMARLPRSVDVGKFGLVPLIPCLATRFLGSASGLSIRSCRGYSRTRKFSKAQMLPMHTIYYSKSGLTWVCLDCYSIYGHGFGDCHPSAIVAINEEEVEGNTFKFDPSSATMATTEKTRVQLRRNSGCWPIDSHDRYVFPRHGRCCNLGNKTSVCSIPLARHHRFALYQGGQRCLEWRIIK